MIRQPFSTAIDIGGTFTDTALAIPGQTQLFTAKNPTTPQDPVHGAIQGLKNVLSKTSIEAGDLDRFIHGTTLATNALIERRGACTAVITTEGFRDILEIAYERRYSQYDIMLQKPDLIVPRSLCFTVRERLDVHGQVRIPLDQRSVDHVIRQISDSNVEAVAVCLLHAYANPVHEQQLRDAIASARSDLYISLSSEVSPEAREFERLCTTVVNAYLQPHMEGYLNRFEQQFKTIGVQCPILMMTSSAGMTTLETARNFPVRLVESGPSGGAVMAARVAMQNNLEQVLSFDMGGTTAKLCLINHYSPKTARNFEVNRAARFIKGSGMPIRIPVVEMIEIGAGGGSIAGIDRLGRITIGPESAGAEPGPAGFNRGGTVATVTDADMVLGYIDPAFFSESCLSLNKQKAEQSVDETIAGKLDLSIDNAAFGISQIVDENMASAGRMHAVESGMNLSTRTMIAFGGNGPLHATRVARRCGINKIVVPNDPGVGSAVGFLDAPVSFELIKSHYTLLDKINVETLNRILDEMLVKAHSVVAKAAVNSQIQSSCSAYMRYHGQGHEIEIPLNDLTLSPDDLLTIKRQFETEYARQYSRIVPDMDIEILNWSVKVTTAAIPPSAVKKTGISNPVRSRHMHTIICDVSGEPVKASVYQRHALKPGDTLSGPALIVEPQTTTLVSQDYTACIDSAFNIIMAAKENIS